MVSGQVRSNPSLDLEEGVESGFSLIRLAGILAALGILVIALQIINWRWQRLRSDVEEQLLSGK